MMKVMLFKNYWKREGHAAHYVFLQPACLALVDMSSFVGRDTRPCRRQALDASCITMTCRSDLGKTPRCGAWCLLHGLGLFVPYKWMR